jgi:ribonuclease P protein component
VVRNRVKRVLREVYRLHQEELITGVQLILVGRQGILGANYEQALVAVKELFRRSKILMEQKRI